MGRQCVRLGAARNLDKKVHSRMSIQWRDAFNSDAKKHYLSVEAIGEAEVRIRYESEYVCIPADVIETLAVGETPDLAVAKVRAFLAGVSAAFRLPPAKGFSFSDAAGSLLPRVVSPEFLAGYRFVAGVSVFGLSIAPGLVAVYLVEGDYVYSYLTQARVDMWGVTDDRISYAARSNLYHTTIKHEPVRFQTPVVHHRYERDDGFDSGRVLLLNDMFWNQVETGLYFAVPAENVAVMAELSTQQDVELLKQKVASLFEVALHPVSPQLYHQHKKTVRVA